MTESVRLFRVRPGGKTGHDVEFLEERADDLIGVGASTEVVELTHDARERGLDVGDGVFRVIGSVLLETSMVFDELFPVELLDRVLRADRPRVGREAWHAGPRESEIVAGAYKSQCSAG